MGGVGEVTPHTRHTRHTLAGTHPGAVPLSSTHEPWSCLCLRIQDPVDIGGVGFYGCGG